jgi:non-ribosomal peptide synthase protein (TIGR01720 family)
VWSVSELRRYVQARLPEYMVPAAFVLLDRLPQTPNGKVDRRGLPAPETVRPDLAQAYEAPRGAVEQVLAEIWAQVLGVARVGRHDNFFELGGDSILSIQIIARAATAGLRLTAKELFQHQTVAALAAVAGERPAVSAAPSTVSGEMALTPVQQWFFEQAVAVPSHFNQASWVTVGDTVDARGLEQSLAAVVAQHDALRLRYERQADGWRQYHAALDACAVPLERVDLSSVDAAACTDVVEQVADRLQAGLDLSAGPVMRAALFEGAGPARLLVVIHHLIVDGVSWRILLEDLGQAYQAVQRGAAVTLGQKTTSFQTWAQRLTDYARSAPVEGELAYWTDVTQGWTDRLPTDGPGAENLVASADTVAVGLDEAETHALLYDAPRAYHTQVNDLLLAALVEAIGAWTGRRAVLLDLEGHGREELFADVDVTRTVGWFTTIFPVRLEVAAAASAGDVLKHVKEQLRAIPQRGIGYGLLRYLGTAALAAQLRHQPTPEVSFNYLGQFEATPGPAWSTGRPTAAVNRRRHLLEINASVVGKRLGLLWTYSRDAHRTTTIAALATSYVDALRGFIRHCLSPDVGGYTPSDFARARLSQRDLDTLLSRVRHAT